MIAVTTREIRVTRWFEHPESEPEFQSAYGRVKIEEWLELERERLENQGIPARVKYNGGGRVTLVRGV